MRVSRLRSSIEKWASSQPEYIYPKEQQLNTTNWEQIKYLIQIGSMFLWVTNTISTEGCTLAATIHFTKLIKSDLEGYIPQLQAIHTKKYWQKQLLQAISLAKKKLQKYIDILLQDEAYFAISLLLEPIPNDSEDHRWNGLRHIWPDLPTDSETAAQHIQNKCEQLFIQRYIKDYSQLIQNQAPTVVSSSKKNLSGYETIAEIASRVSPKKVSL